MKSAICRPKSLHKSADINLVRNNAVYPPPWHLPALNNKESILLSPRYNVPKERLSDVIEQTLHNINQKKILKKVKKQKYV